MMPPHIILKGKTRNALKSWDTERAPSGTLLSVSDSGWIKQGLSLLWFTNVFLPNIGPRRPQVLIFDGHDSHHHVELISTARQNNIILIEIPAHCSHWLQPLDRTFFGPLKTKWKQVVQCFTNETGCTVTHGNFFHLLKRTWTGVLENLTKIVNGFRCTGICPLNENAIPKEAFLPNQLSSKNESDHDITESEVTEVTEKNTSNNKDVNVPIGIEPHTSTQQFPGAPIESTGNSVVCHAEVHNEAEIALVPEAPAITSQTAVECSTFAPFNIDITSSIDSSSGVLQDISLASFLEPGMETSMYHIVDIGYSVVNEKVVETDPNTVVNGACPPELALAAIECSLANGTKQKYEKALQNGSTICDKTFATWKRFKELAEPNMWRNTFPFSNSSSPFDKDCDVLPYHTPVISKTSRKSGEKQKKGFFVITSEEAFAEKMKKAQEKELREKQKLLKINLKSKNKKPS